MLHKTSKKMYARSRKRGPRLALQLMRGDEAKSALLRELAADDRDNESPGESLGEVVDASGSPPVGAAANCNGGPADLPRDGEGRGERFTVRDL